MRGKLIFRPFLLHHAFNFRSISSSSSSSSLLFSLNQNYLLSTPKACSLMPSKPFPFSTLQNPTPSRPFSDSPSQPESLSVPPNVVPIKSEEEFDAAVSKAEGDSMPSVFYFTATWCGPCKLIAPIMDELAQKNPHVTTYKLDIDEEALAIKLETLNVTAVPTLRFFKGGKMEDEVIGADVMRIVQTMKKLYEKQD